VKEGILSDAKWSNLKYYSGVRLEVLRKTTKNLIQADWSVAVAVTVT
jgi:hypothetical protein